MTMVAEQSKAAVFTNSSSEPSCLDPGSNPAWGYEGLYGTIALIFNNSLQWTCFECLCYSFDKCAEPFLYMYHYKSTRT